MKNHFRLSVLLLALCLLFCFAGCNGQENVVTEPTQTTVPPTTVPATTAPPDPADIYLESVNALGSSVGMEIKVAQTMTVSGQVFTTNAVQTLNLWNIGEDSFFAKLEDTTNYGDYEYSRTEYFSDGAVYQTLNDCRYTAKMDEASFLSRYPSLQMFDPSLYTVTLEDDGKTIRFSDATAMESWLVDEEAVPVSVEATVTLDDNGKPTQSVYSVEYTYGPAQYITTYTITYRNPGDPVTLPGNTANYLITEDIDGIWLLDHAYGYLLQAQQYSTNIASTVQSQAAGLVLNTQIGVDTWLSDSGRDYLVDTSVYAMDQTGSIETSNKEKFVDGHYTSVVDDGEETTNTMVTASLMQSYADDFLTTGIMDTTMFEGAEISDLGSMYLVEFCCTEEFALALCEDFCATYLGQANILQSISTKYQTNQLEYYISLDKYTMLPLACGFTYEGCHTIQGYDCLLIQQMDQSFDLASLTAHDAIYDEPVPDAEPETKPTPLFYKVTGPDGQQMWLFGTIHVGDDRTAFLPQEIYDALLSSDALAVECDTKGFEEALKKDEKLQSQVSDCYYYSDSTISDHIETDDLYEDAVKVMKGTGNYFYNAEYMKPSLWSSAIENFYLSQGRQLTSEKGIEHRLEKIAEENNIPLWEVESALFQVQMTTGYSDYLQEFQLYSSIYAPAKEYWESVAELYELWCAGDEAALIEEMKREVWAFKEEDLEETDDMTEEDLEDLQYIRDNMESINAELEKIYQEYIKAMEIDRNAGMLNVAKGYLESGKTVFYAVGLAHLLAEDGLVNTLRAAGYTVELVQYK